MSGSAARGRPTRPHCRTAPASPAASVCQTRAGAGARSFEEAEATRHQGERGLKEAKTISTKLRPGPVKKAHGRMDRAEASFCFVAM